MELVFYLSVSYLIFLLILSVLFYTGVLSNIKRYLHMRIKGVLRVDSIQTIAHSVREGSVYFEKQYVEFYADVLRRVGSGQSVLIMRDPDLCWFVRTDEKEDSGHTLYHANKNYRFKLFIRKIEYNADDNEGKGEYTVWSTMV